MVRTPHCYHASPPFVAMVTIFPPDWSAKRVPAFDVNIQSANSTAVHMMPKHQTSAISYCLIVRYGFDASVISRPAWRRCFDVHVISCKKVVKPVSQNRKERLSSSAWLPKQRQHQGRTGAREGWRDFTVRLPLERVIEPDHISVIHLMKIQISKKLEMKLCQNVISQRREFLVLKLSLAFVLCFSFLV